MCDNELLMVLQDLLTRSDIALNESKKSFASDLACIESTRAELKNQNTKMKKELDASQEKVKSLTDTMKDLGMYKFHSTMYYRWIYHVDRA